ncbi:MAG: multiple resistance and pH regulation protein F, partial [Pseudolabrys sp.]
MAMANFLFGAAAFVLVMLALGLLSILRGPNDVDRMLSAQLIGTGGVAVLLLLAVVTDMPSIT